MMIIPTPHEKNEWARMAQAAYNHGHSAVGHKYAGLARLRNGVPITRERFDDAQAQYRAWLMGNVFPKH